MQWQMTSLQCYDAGQCLAVSEKNSILCMIVFIENIFNSKFSKLLIYVCIGILYFLYIGSSISRKKKKTCKRKLVDRAKEANV